MFMYGQDVTANNLFTIVKIRYCRDTKPEDQWARATNQHKELLEALQGYTSARGPRVYAHQANIMLGVTGAIYKTAAEELDNLGIEGTALDTLLKELHFVAVEGVEMMWKQRYATLVSMGKIKRANWSKQKKRQTPAVPRVYKKRMKR